MLFHDPKSPAAQMMTAIPTDFKALETMYVERVKRFATASKFLWPIPDRGLKKRAYRIQAPTLLLWGDDDKLIPPVYAKEFTSRIKNCKLELIKNAGPHGDVRAAGSARERDQEISEGLNGIYN